MVDRSRHTVEVHACGDQHVALVFDKLGVGACL
jgi:hypothetical protein